MIECLAVSAMKSKLLKDGTGIRGQSLGVDGETKAWRAPFGPHVVEVKHK